MKGYTWVTVLGLALLASQCEPKVTPVADTQATFGWAAAECLERDAEGNVIATHADGTTWTDSDGTTHTCTVDGYEVWQRGLDAGWQAVASVSSPSYVSGDPGPLRLQVRAFRSSETGGFSLPSDWIELTGVAWTADRLPVDLTGTPPETHAVVVWLRDPPPASATVTLDLLNAFDADAITDSEGSLHVNGRGPIPLFGGASVDATGCGDNLTCTVRIDAPSDWWREGDNWLVFSHSRTYGYRFDDLGVTLP